MVNIIDPKVEVVDYGPKIVVDGQVVMTPDQVVYSASGITFKDTDFFQQARDQIAAEQITPEKMRDNLINSAGAGHASLATTPFLWLAVKGDASKMVDSMFTGAVYSTSLMPSGRRIPVAEDQIVVPRGIAHKGASAIERYLKTSEANIDAYEQLMKQGVKKEEAAKIVQYGHRGGGFLGMPLETVASFARQFKENKDAIPREGLEIIAQIEDFIHSHGMGITYAARMNAPRESCPNPGIFHYGRNLTELVEMGRVLVNPVLMDVECFDNPERDKKIKKYLERRQKVFSDPENLHKNWRGLLAELGDIVNEFNDSVSVTTLSNSPWRVWGEVKRHRTLDQTAESVYCAARRTLELVKKTGVYITQGNKEQVRKLSEDYEEVFSMPPSIKGDDDKLRFWIGRVVDSFETYDTLVSLGVAESDAIHVIPRGMKFGIQKRFDLYNLTTGYMSLRLCDTCEPEMKRTTELERRLVIESRSVPDAIKELLTPKCSYVGFCPEGDYDKRCCKQVRLYVPGYDKDVHTLTQQARKAEIIRQIGEK